jgi:SNF2 family DNA or RNA helicase
LEWDQAEARCHRIGQTFHVTYRDYVYKDSIEEDILAALRTKSDLAAHIKNVGMIKDILLRATK